MFKNDHMPSKTFLKDRYLPWLVSIILLTSDIISISLAFLFSTLIRYSLIPWWGGVVNVDNLLLQYFVALPLIIDLFLINGMYPGIGRTGVTELKQIFRATSIAFLFLGFAIFIFKNGTDFSRMVFVVSWFFCLILISSSRLFLHNRGSLISWWNQPAVVVGRKKDVEQIIRYFYRSRRMAIKPVVSLVIDSGVVSSKIEETPTFVYSYTNQEMIKNQGIDLVIYASSPTIRESANAKYLYSLSLTYPNLIYIMNESSLNSLSMKIYDLEGHPALKVQYNLINPFKMKVKRVFDFLLCILSAIIVFPFLALFSLIIKVDSPGPIFFRQPRMGREGKIFNLIKFRTMANNSDVILRDLLANNEDFRKEYEKFHKLKNDPGITRFGKFLRKTSLDELPQIINILRGEMSWVGPRAYLPYEKEQMGDSADLILRVIPGMTGWWQVMGRHEVSFDERLRLDKYYISNFSLWMDFYVMFKTIWIVFSGKGV